MYLVYLLKSDNLTYIGMTNDFFRRWRQHNCEIKGGAKYTTRRGKDWYPICIVDGFQTMKEAMQCEWKLKRKHGYLNRIRFFSFMMTESQWTSKSPKIKDQNLQVYVIPRYQHLFTIPTHELFWF